MDGPQSREETGLAGGSGGKGGRRRRRRRVEELGGRGEHCPAIKAAESTGWRDTGAVLQLET